MASMKVEQALAAHWPAVEHKIESFEKYEDASNTVRNNPTYGIQLLIEGEHPSNIENYLRTFGDNFLNKSGVPASFILLCEGVPTEKHRSLMNKYSNIVACLPLSQILSPDEGKQAVKYLWTQFLDSLERRLMPETLSAEILDFKIARGGRLDGITFKSEVTKLLSLNANLNWQEQLALKWIFSFERSFQVSSSSLFGEKFLAVGKIVESVFPSLQPSFRSLDEIATSSAPLAIRIGGAAKLLERWRTSGVLEKRLSSHHHRIKHHPSFILRSLVRQRTNILSMSMDLEAKSQNSDLRRTG